MCFYSFNLEKPVRYFMGGEFTSHKEWIHQKRYHKGDYEFFFCIKGPLYLQVNGEQFTVKTNSVLIVPPYMELVGFKPSEKPVDFYWFHFFEQGDVQSYEGDVKNFTAVYANIKNHVTLPMIFTVNHSQSIAINLHQIISAKQKACPIQKRDFLISSLIIELFNDFYENFEPSDEHSRLQYIRKYITTNMSSDLTVESVAESVHLNRNYLTRLFKKHLGVTTNQYITNLKLEAASLLLLRTDMPIKAVATEAFFSNPHIFMRRFKAVKGLSPSKYRQKFQNINKNTADISPFIPIPARIANLINDGANEKI